MRRERLIRPTIRHQPHSTSSSLPLCAVCPNPSATCSHHHRQTSTQALRKVYVASFYTGNWCREYLPDLPYPASLPAVALTGRCCYRRCSAVSHDSASASSTSTMPYARHVLAGNHIYAEHPAALASPVRDPDTDRAVPLHPDTAPAFCPALNPHSPSSRVA